MTEPRRSEAINSPQKAPSRWLSSALLKYPLLADLMRLAYGLIQPRYTAGVVGVIFNDAGEMLIVEHAFHPRHPWGLPGGWTGRGESPAAALSRELREELELTVEIVRPLVIDNATYSKAHLDISFLCQASGPVGQISDELISYRWTRAEALPDLLAFHRRSVEAARAVLSPQTDVGP